MTSDYLHATAHARTALDSCRNPYIAALAIGSVEMAVAGGEEPFQEGCWGEDDDYECEEETGSQNDSLETRQRNAREAGMIQVGAEGWREAVKRKLSDITGLDWGSMDDAMDAVEKAGKATCVVRRGCDSQERIDYLERMAVEASSGADKEKHRKKAKKARRNCRGVGTGLLLSPRSPLGYLVITNCHAVMNASEAEGARITFDYLIDDKKDGMRKFDVGELLAWSPRTTSGDDRKNLDFCILAVKITKEDDECFLKERAIYMEETRRIQAADDNHLKMTKVKRLPLIMFSHPCSLSLRISVGKFPENIQEYPVSHIKHDLPTFRGSSGANILFSAIDDKSFLYWRTAFVHYRHGCAVAWQAIGPQIRDYFAARGTAMDREMAKELFEQADHERMENVLASDTSNHPYQEDYVRGKLQLRM